MNKQTTLSENFWLQWIMSNAIAWLFGFGVLVNLVGGSPLLFGLLFGAIIGTAQFLTTKRRGKLTQLIIANIIGWTVGVLIAEFVSRMPFAVFNGISDLLFFILFGAIGGGSSATLVYFLQRHIINRNFRLFMVLATSHTVAGM